MFTKTNRGAMDGHVAGLEPPSISPNVQFGIIQTNQEKYLIFTSPLAFPESSKGWDLHSMM
jgi:hypothetical protein